MLLQKKVVFRWVWFSLSLSELLITVKFRLLLDNPQELLWCWKRLTRISKRWNVDRLMTNFVLNVTQLSKQKKNATLFFHEIVPMHYEFILVEHTNNQGLSLKTLRRLCSNLWQTDWNCFSSQKCPCPDSPICAPILEQKRHDAFTPQYHSHPTLYLAIFNLHRIDTGMKGKCSSNVATIKRERQKDRLCKEIYKKITPTKWNLL